MTELSLHTTGIFLQLVGCGNPAIFGSFREALASEIKGSLKEEKIDEAALTQALDAIPRCFEAGLRGHYRRLQKLRSRAAESSYRSFSSYEAAALAEHHLWILLIIDNDPENIRADLCLPGASPELLTLLADVARARLKRGRPAFDSENLSFQICFHWPGNLHRASVAAGCALLMARGAKLSFPHIERRFAA